MNFSDLPEVFAHSKRFMISLSRQSKKVELQPDSDDIQELCVARKLCVEIQPWIAAPPNHIGLGPEVARALQISHVVGEMIKLAFPHSAWDQTATQIRIYPVAENSRESKVEKGAMHEDWAALVKDHLLASDFLGRPLTEGMLVSIPSLVGTGTTLSLLQFGAHKDTWTILPSKGRDARLLIENEIPSGPLGITPESLKPKTKTTDQRVVCMDEVINDSLKHIARNAGILVTGNAGSGKTCLLEKVIEHSQKRLFRCKYIFAE